MNLLKKMDSLVFATRIDRIIFLKIQPRTFRWIPLVVIAALVAGYVLMAKTVVVPGRGLRGFLTGWLLFYGALIAANLLRIFGPRFLATALRPLDERELMVKARAYAISGTVLAGFAMLGCFYMASAGVPGLWHPHAPMDWFNLGFGVQALAILLPTWIASWIEPRPVEDRDD